MSSASPALAAPTVAPIAADQDLAQLYERYGFLVHRRCLALLRNPADADDALQETFLRARRYGGNARPPSALAWLYAIAAHCCFDLMARRDREDPLDPARVGELDTRTQGSADDSDRRALLGAVLRELDEKTRMIGILHYLDGYTQEEVAEQTGYSRRTVGKKLQLFEKLLRQAWPGQSEKETP